MKRFLSLLLCCSLLFCAAGCRQQADEIDGTPFYYCAKTASYSADGMALDAEYRMDVPVDSLTSALDLYLQGPLSQELLSPFPQGIRLVGLYQNGSTVFLTFSRELATLSGLDLTMACSCITLTALALTDAQEVEIRVVSGLLNGQRSIVMNKNTILLQDTAGE